MDERILSALKRYHKFDAWRDQTTLDANLFVWQAQFQRQELSGWEPHSIQAIEPTEPVVHTIRSEVAGSADRTISLETAGATPRVIQSIWQRPGARVEALLSIDLYPCDSRAQAHEFVVQLLANFQSSLLRRIDDVPCGDVAFSPPGSSAIMIFARANLVLLLRNAGRQLVPITEVAYQIDRELIARPEMPTEDAEFALTGFEVSLGKRRAIGKGRAKAKLPLDIAVSQLEPVMYKVFSDSGEIRHEGPRLVYYPRTIGQQALEVYAIAPQTTARRSLQFELE